MTAHEIVHLLPDSVFLPFVVDVFQEALPGENRFVVYGASRDVGRHVLPSGIDLEVIDAERLGPVGSRGIFADARIAISHSMSTFSAEALIAAPERAVTVWSGWGSDYYGTSWNPSAGLIGRETKRILNKSKRASPTQLAQRVASWPYVHRLYRAAAERADVFSAPVPTDLRIFRQRFPRFSGRYHQLNYASIEDTYDTSPDRVAGTDILVGNSATPENNHVEVLRKLASLELGDRRVVIPLSYGDPVYADHVVQAARDLLGDRLVALRDYMPLSDYNAVIGSCGFIAMGHRRQQGLGNIARAVWQGAEVFLDRRNPILDYLRDEAIPVHDLRELVSDGLPGEHALVDDGELAVRRQNARSLWGRDIVIENIHRLVDGAERR